MKKEDFYNTSWDASDWTVEQKIKWQEKCFELGFSWKGETEVKFTQSNFYQLGYHDITWDYEHARVYTIKQYSDMFPDEVPAKQFTQEEMIQYIVDQVNERTSEEETVDEDERGFEGLECVWDGKITLYLDFNKLSEDQIEFCYDYFKKNGMWDYFGDSFEVHNSFVLDRNNGKVWVSCYASLEREGIPTSFNDIFQYKE